jgi:hypothetical protein
MASIGGSRSIWFLGWEFNTGLSLTDSIWWGWGCLKTCGGVTVLPLLLYSTWRRAGGECSRPVCVFVCTEYSKDTNRSSNSRIYLMISWMWGQRYCASNPFVGPRFMGTLEKEQLTPARLQEEHCSTFASDVASHRI